MRGILGAICAELGTEAGRRLFPCHAGVRRAKKLPPGRNGIIAHQLHGNDRTRGHKLQQVTTGEGEHLVIQLSILVIYVTEQERKNSLLHYSHHSYSVDL